MLIKIYKEKCIKLNDHYKEYNYPIIYDCYDIGFNINNCNIICQLITNADYTEEKFLLCSLENKNIIPYFHIDIDMVADKYFLIHSECLKYIFNINKNIESHLQELFNIGD